MQKIIIAIDGWSSCGKSTLAKQLAKKLNYTYIDSGAMYRAITLYFLRNHLDWTDVKDVYNALLQIHLEFIHNMETGYSDMWLNGEDVEYVIRDLVVAEKVSEVAAIKEVRDFAVSQQRRMGDKKGIVMDGRDIGTIVFPNAELKLFMTADMLIRAFRRQRELLDRDQLVDLDEVIENIQHRDQIDTTRKESPLRQAEDAIVIDTTHIAIDEQVDEVIRMALGKIIRTH